MRNGLFSLSSSSAIVVCCLAFLGMPGLAGVAANAVEPIFQDRSPQPGSPVKTKQGRLEVVVRQDRDEWLVKISLRNTGDIPKGSKRLYVDLEMEVNGDPYGVMISASVFSRNSFGWAPTVIIEKDGSVPFSALASEMRAEQAKMKPRPSIEEQIEWQKKQDAQGTSSK